MAVSMKNVFKLYGIYILFVLAIIGVFLLANMFTYSDGSGPIGHVSTADKVASDSAPSISAEKPAKTKPSGSSSGSSSASTADSSNPSISSSKAKNASYYTIEANTPPTQGTPILNSTFGTNLTSENLTVYNQSTYDADENSVKNIINWNKNGQPIAVLNMPFEGGSNSTWTRDYAFGNNGTVNGATWSSIGGYDGKGAYQFDGSNDYISIPNNPNLILTEQVTLAAWVKRTRFSIDMILEKGGDWSVGETNYAIGLNNANNNMFYFFYKGGWRGVSGVSDTNWHHYAVVAQNGTANPTMYIDGVAQTIAYSSGSSVINLYPSTRDLHIGAQIDPYPSYPSNYYGGNIIDDVFIFNRSLSPEQVKALYNNRTDRIVSQELSAGQTWQACMTPNDGYADGSTSCSNNLIIRSLGNNPPTQGTPILNSTLGTNLTSENLTVYNQSTYDADGNSVKNIINWNKNGQSIAVLNMPFEGGSNSTFTKDYSGFGNNGTVSGATWNATGGYDGKGAYQFNGIDNYIDCGNAENLQIQGSITLAAWIKPNSLTDGEHKVIHKANSTYRGYEIFIWNESLRGRVGAYDDANAREIGVNNTIQLGWQHIALTWNGSVATLYYNGVAVYNKTITGSSGNTLEPLKIGKRDFHGPDIAFFNGSIDDAFVYNYALSPDQIKALYNNRTDRIVSQELANGQTWQACITPNDGYQDGTTNCSNSLTVSGPIKSYPNCPGGTNGEWNVTSNYMISNNVECNIITVKNGASIIVNNTVYNRTINITAGNLTIETGGSINAIGKGFSGGSTQTNGKGPGAGISQSGGAGYGGNGGGGSANGGGSGGGAVFLNITDTFMNNGTIRVDGSDGPVWNGYYGGAGSGGSVYIITNNLQGNGSVTANGGNNAGAAAGGGGRIAIYYTTKNFNGLITAYGGTGNNKAGAGTIYLKDSSNYGELIIDNNETLGAITPVNETLTLYSLIIGGKAYIRAYSRTINVTNNFLSKNVILDNVTIIGTADGIVNGSSTWNGQFT
ncbi:MAG: LamG domain-containing protein, partial [Candidatus Micrarchaeota archaeon]|nr:LamG domain-containing protein [Candidatus Micrarchaeota archaeon]